MQTLSASHSGYYWHNTPCELVSVRSLYVGLKLAMRRRRHLPVINNARNSADLACCKWLLQQYTQTSATPETNNVTVFGHLRLRHLHFSKIYFETFTMSKCVTF